MNTSPCLNCTRRNVGCHATCEAYELFADDLAEKKRAKDEYHAKNGEIGLYVFAIQNRIRRANGKPPMDNTYGYK